MQVLPDIETGCEPVDEDTEARGDWEDQYAWQADQEIDDYKASLGPRGWL